MQITYQKRDGSIIQRLRNTMIPYKIGDTTSMGWKVLNIEYEYNNQYYSKNDYNIILNKNKKIFIKRKQAVELCVNEFKTFLYYFVALLLISFIKIMLGI